MLQYGSCIDAPIPGKGDFVHGVDGAEGGAVVAPDPVPRLKVLGLVQDEVLDQVPDQQAATEDAKAQQSHGPTEGGQEGATRLDQHAEAPKEMKRPGDPQHSRELHHSKDTESGGIVCWRVGKEGIHHVEIHHCDKYKGRVQPVPRIPKVVASNAVEPVEQLHGEDGGEEVLGEVQGGGDDANRVPVRDAKGGARFRTKTLQVNGHG
mmetsp:Transcript_39216/g.93729  ORF Transcript_39216/g.93729 Transcript_39216/m.93729 type:complete len:207 (+) Transcript_39216:598-1218(+)